MESKTPTEIGDLSCPRLPKINGMLEAEAHVHVSCDMEALVLRMSNVFAEHLEKLEHRLIQEIKAKAMKEWEGMKSHAVDTAEVKESSVAVRSPRDASSLRGNAVPEEIIAQADPPGSVTARDTENETQKFRRKSRSSFSLTSDDSAIVSGASVEQLAPLQNAEPRLPRIETINSTISTSTKSLMSMGHTLTTFSVLEKKVGDLVAKDRKHAKFATPTSRGSELVRIGDELECGSQSESLQSRGFSSRTSRFSFACFTRIMPETRCDHDCCADGGTGTTATSGTTLTSLQHYRQDELLILAMERQGVKTFDFDAPLWLYMSGIFPCRYCWNQLMILALLVAVLAFYLHLFLAFQGEDASETCNMASMCLEDVVAPMLALTFGCFLRLLGLIFLSDHVVGSSDALLTRHVHELGVMDSWISQSKRDMGKMLLFWTFMVGMCIYVASGWNVNVAIVTHVAAFAFTLHIFSALAFSMLHICQGLFLGIDSFCGKVIESSECENAVEDWNMFQAILRRACIPVARTFILVLTSSLAATFSPTIFATSLFAMLPGALLLLVVLWVSLFIGDVTNKCERVATFINMLDFGTMFDEKRQYVVNYINNSRAGFYMFDVRVTAEMVVKCTYVGIVVAAAFTTRALSSS